MALGGKYRGWITSLLVCFAPPLLGAGPPDSGKKLIEFGWDEPDTTFMRKHIAEMKQTPLDGCVFHMVTKDEKGVVGDYIWSTWGRRAFKESDFAHAVTDLQATDFGKFSHNFLRFNTAPANLSWFDDFDAILNNTRLAAKVARLGGAKGLLFDIEQYNEPLFKYRKQSEKDKRSWDEYARQVRQRGREVMSAFQDGFPDLVVFLTFGYSLPWAQCGGHPEKLPDADYGLLAPFLDGLVDGVRGRTRLIDGNENAYGFKVPADFEKSRELILHGMRPIVADQEKYGRHFSVSYGLWLDLDRRNSGWNLQDFSKNLHTPAQFEDRVRSALRNADEYVWIYTESPRWWTEKGGTEKLPTAYIDAIRRAKTMPASQPASGRSP